LNHKFYILLTDCGNYTILLTEMKNGLKEYLESHKDENIYKIFDNLYTVNKIFIVRILKALILMMRLRQMMEGIFGFQVFLIKKKYI
jgi:hypothetical protein